MWAGGGGGGLERAPGERTRQSLMLDNAKLAERLLSDQESQYYGFQVFPLGFNNEYLVNLSSMIAIRYKYPLRVENHIEFP